ncbi:MAG: hypothetical protein PWQ97_57 [Tepidanaerobacteraceae bacterium]|nr:hypothetical protein [Tepidanaerobacteraceae bacterium]
MKICQGWVKKLSDVKTLEMERQQIFIDLFRGNVPSRIPVKNPLAFDAIVEYSNLNLAEVYWDMTRAEEAFDKVCQEFFSDVLPGSNTQRSPSFYQLLGSKSFVMASNGVMQHPNVEGMLPEDYDEFIASPYDCIIEKILPRLYTELDTEDPNIKSLTLAKAMRAYGDETETFGALSAKLRARYGYASIPGGQTEAPYDFLADCFRSFTGISKDIRRIPDKVVAACEAVMPLLIKKGRLPAPSDFGMTLIPLHMAPYMRLKDFEKFYWPTLKKQVEALTEMGINVLLFLENDWMRYLDYLYELPENTILRFEYGDPKIVKDKLGKKHIISGFYPISLLHEGTKEQCIDKAKELLDILAPGGKYWFDFDKSVLDLHGNIVENLKSVLQYVYENGRYSESERLGNTQRLGRVDNTDRIISEIDKNIKSKYFTTWEKYKEKHSELEDRPESVISEKIKKYEDLMFNFIISLCL